MKKQFSPDAIFWISIPIILLLGIIAGDHVLDIWIFGRDLIISYIFLTIISISILALNGFLYTFFLRSYLVTLGTGYNWAIFLTIGGLFILMLIASITGALTEGISLSMDIEQSVTFIMLIFVSLISVLIGVILTIILLIKKLSQTKGSR